MVRKLEKLPLEVQEILQIALLTEIDEDAFIMLNAFFDAKPEYDRQEAFEVLDSYGSRFYGFNALEVIDLTYQNISGHNLYITPKKALKFQQERVKFKLVAYKEIQQ